METLSEQMEVKDVVDNCLAIDIMISEKGASPVTKMVTRSGESFILSASMVVAFSPNANITENHTNLQ